MRQCIQLIQQSFQQYRLHPLPGYSILLLPMLIMGVSIFLREDRSYIRITRRLYNENQPIELITFGTLLLGGLLGLRLAWKLRHTPPTMLYSGFYTLFGLGLVFVAMEEISWGQWFYYFETPESIKAINKQREMNFHNLPMLHAPFEFLRVAFGVGGIVGIYLSFKAWSKPVGAPPILFFWFLFIAILAGLDIHNYFYRYEYSSIYGMAARQVEVLEMLIGCSALFYMWLNSRLLFSKQG